MASRIALVPSSYAPYVGGVEEHTRHVARELATAGHDVEVWTVRRTAGETDGEVDGIRVRRLPCPLPSATVAGMVRYASAAPTAWAAWARAIVSFDPDVLHVHCFGPNGVYAHRSAIRHEIPLVVSLHGETFMDDHSVFEDSRLLRLALRRTLRAAAAVTGCSQVTVDDAVARFGLEPGRGQVVPNGVRFGRVRRASTWTPPFRRYVAAVGRMVPHKGFDLLLESFARLSAPDLGLVLGGDGSQRAAMRERARVLGVADRVELPGTLDTATVAAVMAGAEAVVVPSRIEPFGIVVLEAWRSGAAVIATSRGGPREFVTDGTDGLLVDPLDPAALDTALRRITDEPELRAALATAGRRRVRDFTWTRTAREYEAIYDSALSTRTEVPS